MERTSSYLERRKITLCLHLEDALFTVYDFFGMSSSKWPLFHSRLGKDPASSDSEIDQWTCCGDLCFFDPLPCLFCCKVDLGNLWPSGKCWAARVRVHPWLEGCRFSLPNLQVLQMDAWECRGISLEGGKTEMSHWLWKKDGLQREIHAPFLSEVYRA